MAFEFDGTNQYFTSDPCFTTTPVAFSAWVKHDLSESSVRIFQSQGPGGHSFAVKILADDTLEVSVSDGSTATAVTTSARPVNTWFHVFAAWNSTTHRSIYLDGGSVGTDATPIVPNAQNILTVAARTGGGFELDGSLAEVAFWTGSGAENLGAAEAGFLAAGFSPLCLTEYLGNLECYQPMVRDINWNSTGPVFTSVNGHTVEAHPRILFPNQNDNSLRAPGASSAGRVQKQGFIPFGLNFER